MPEPAESPESQLVAAVDSAPRDAPEMSADAVASSTPFVGRWNELVSTTNWEKGRIIADWRAELERSGAPITDYSDEAWARLVGGVTSQHVGRLRRAHERFGGVYAEYPGLYWSHFQAALDWDDAEVWLEGALAGRQSVSQMRAARWEAHGGSPAEGPGEGEVLEARLGREEDDAFAADEEGAPDAAEPAPETGERSADAHATDAPRETSPGGDPSDEDAAAAPTAPKPRPFADLAELPEDVAEAFEAMKLAILNHRLAGWREVRQDDLVGALEALKTLALAPPDEAD